MKHTPTIAPTETPTLSDLAYILRHKELWPRDFEWHWSNCHTCAMGLFFRFYGIEGEPNAPSAAKVFGISLTEALDLFMSTHWFRPHGGDSIKPEDVANGIERFLASRGTPSHG